jgi:hypothetical protein
MGRDTRRVVCVLARHGAPTESHGAPRDHPTDALPVRSTEIRGAIGFQNRLRADLLRRPGRAPTEVLLHFSVSTIARMGGILTAGRARGGLSMPERKTLTHADTFLGGDWWRAEFDSLRDTLTPTAGDGTPWVDLDELAVPDVTDSANLITATDIAMRVAHRFCAGLGRQTGYRTVAMPVRPEEGRAPKYIMVLFTRNDHGIWHFADALGRAGQHWQAALHEERDRARSAKLATRLSENLGMFELDDLTPTSPSELVSRNMT